MNSRKGHETHSVERTKSAPCGDRTDRPGRPDDTGSTHTEGNGEGGGEGSRHGTEPTRRQSSCQHLPIATNTILLAVSGFSHSAQIKTFICRGSGARILKSVRVSVIPKFYSIPLKRVERGIWAIEGK